jgi:hypothetical protein
MDMLFYFWNIEENRINGAHDSISSNASTVIN